MDEHIRFDCDALELHLLDQRLLPEEEADFVCRAPGEVITALQTMVVRGAPAIGVTAAWGCVLAVAVADESEGWQERLAVALEDIARARPTAVNLRWAVDCLRARWHTAGELSRPALLELFLREAQAMQDEDVAVCKALGRFGADCLEDGDTVLTHCNAGALATAGYGTALGVIRAAVERGKRIRVIADETRPFLQGARLTAWELQRDGIPVSVACDNACALLMQKGLVQRVVVGADRIAANGDAANKIGTFGVALLARHFGIPFYVAAPLSTIDPQTADGASIPVEERPAGEVTHIGGRRVTPVDVSVYNFAFDVTPAALISGIVTEAGVLQPPYGPAIKAALADARR
ncbi:S-methyl-5-thioribose-1-phosphate isomerase [uncultured Desulfovibrio sp.]|uniref:S-methyl-5-thioribose-1-phosphate isomerase n=1 Tax=uncultured Desulfovibrio sp. TaxID=167968 RepID=UPI00260769D2|nr:S-methyl-5-thioribose-1-phosphate isomerase [uncultured Desulfovibrio sp.]